MPDLELIIDFVNTLEREEVRDDLAQCLADGDRLGEIAGLSEPARKIVAPFLALEGVHEVDDELEIRHCNL